MPASLLSRYAAAAILELMELAEVQARHRVVLQAIIDYFPVDPSEDFPDDLKALLQELDELSRQEMLLTGSMSESIGGAAGRAERFLSPDSPTRGDTEILLEGLGEDDDAVQE